MGIRNDCGNRSQVKGFPLKAGLRVRDRDKSALYIRKVQSKPTQAQVWNHATSRTPRSRPGLGTGRAGFEPVNGYEVSSSAPSLNMGKIIVKVAPEPHSLSTLMSPPWSFMNP